MAVKGASTELDSLHRRATHLRGELMTVTCVVLGNPVHVALVCCEEPVQSLLASIKVIV